MCTAKSTTKKSALLDKRAGTKLIINCPNPSRHLFYPFLFLHSISVPLKKAITSIFIIKSIFFAIGSADIS